MGFGMLNTIDSNHLQARGKRNQCMCQLMFNIRRETENYVYTCIRKETYRMEELMARIESLWHSMGVEEEWEKIKGELSQNNF